MACLHEGIVAAIGRDDGLV